MVVSGDGEEDYQVNVRNNNGMNRTYFITNGTYRIVNVPSGKYEFSLFDIEGRIAAPVVEALIQGGENEVCLNRGDKIEVTGHFVDLDGNRISGYVEFKSRDGASIIAATDDTLEFRINIPKGGYWCVFRSIGHDLRSCYVDLSSSCSLSVTMDSPAQVDEWQGEEESIPDYDTVTIEGLFAADDNVIVDFLSSDNKQASLAMISQTLQLNPETACK